MFTRRGVLLKYNKLSMELALTNKKQRTSRKPKPNRRQAVQPFVDALPPRGVNLSRSVIQPPALRVKLRFYIDFQVSNAGLQTASKSYYCNGVYDVDPALGSNTVPGFTQYSGLYNSWRVDECSIDFTATNGDAFASQVVVAWFPNATYSATNSYLANKYANRFTTHRILSQAGGMDRCRIRERMKMADLYGDPSSYYGSTSNFVGTGATNPQSLFTVIFGVTPGHAVPFVNGVILNGYMDFIVTFFDPASLTNV
jgi:hypothetical protein